MKKLLLNFLLLLISLTMVAADCSITFSEQGYENAQEITSVALDNAITLVFDKGSNSNTPKYYNTGSAVRLYAGNQLTVTGAAGVTITGVEFTFDASNPIVEGSEVSVGELNIADKTATWTGQAESLTLTEGGTKGHARIESVTVTYSVGEAPTVAPVQFSVAAGQILPGTKVEMTCATEDAVIYYSTDGTEPTTESAQYTEPIAVDSDVTIVAIAVKDGVQSKPAEVAYTVIKRYESLAEIVALEPQTKFVCGIDLTVFEARGAYVFVYDPKTDDYALIYKYDLGLEPCNVIEAGWVGTVAVYGRLNQLVPDTDLTVSDEDGDLPDVLEVDADNIADIYVVDNVRKPYILRGVKMTAAYNKKNGSGILGETEINLYNQFSIDVEGIEADQIYDIYGILNSYNGTLQINPVEFELAEVVEPEVPAVHLYDSVAETTQDDDWGESTVPVVKDIAVEVYDQYVIVRGFAGVEGYDIKVGFGEDDAVAYVASIVEGVEGEAITEGYAYLYTGLDDVPYLTAYIGEGYDYAGLDEDESGYVMLSGYWGEDWTYYYIYWPQEAEVVDPQEPETPVYTSVGEVCPLESLGATSVPEIKDVTVDAYDGYVIIRAYAGVEGYDLKISFGEDETITSVTPIVDGVEGEANTTLYFEVPTGLEDAPKFSIYMVNGYCSGMLGEDESGYVLLKGYWGGTWGYYHCYWPQGVETETPIYTAEAQVTDTEGWGETSVPEINDLKVDVFEGYVVIRGFAGVEGYDMEVGLGEDDSVTYIASIVDGVKSEAVTSGYANVPTGRDDVDYLKAYLRTGYCYAGLYDDESGYVLLSADWGDAWTYYYCVWPQGQEEEWVNPFEGEVAYLYSAIGETASVDDDEDWDESLFPVISNIDIDVYDKYIYIKNIAGVDGYGAKVAYNADDEVLSIMPVEDGVDGEPCKVYAYLNTGIEEVSTIQAYNDYSYAQTYDDKSGYVLLSAYLYGANNLAAWNYYYVVWDNELSAVSSITVGEGTTVYFDIKGNIVDRPAAGNVYIRVTDGKATKVFVK